MSTRNYVHTLSERQGLDQEMRLPSIVHDLDPQIISCPHVQFRLHPEPVLETTKTDRGYERPTTDGQDDASGGKAKTSMNMVQSIGATEPVTESVHPATTILDKRECPENPLATWSQITEWSTLKFLTIGEGIRPPSRSLISADEFMAELCSKVEEAQRQASLRP
ncbi:hypothetical protein CPC08DRAFT_764657 [Agrocybe pediades]|nr:hypothetical protein CPC08DRAFT_764657 [Agrocybe pediades]